MVGKQEGVNFPLPHQDVIAALKNVSAYGTPIVLCTAKFGHAIENIALQAELRNPHITDGGALIIDWLDDGVVAQYPLESTVVHSYTQSCLEFGIHTEIYTADTYYVQASQVSEFTHLRTKLLQAEPLIVTSLLDIAAQESVIKVINFSKGKDDMPKLESNIRRYGDKVTFVWSQNPFLAPRRGMVVTSPGVSKQHAAAEVMKRLKIPFEAVLGIGDSESDWNFMQLCGYVATVEEDSAALQQLAKSKGEGRYYFGSSVDDHGIIEILKHFKVIGA